MVGAVQAAIGQTVPGPFGYAERWDEEAGEYRGLAIEGGSAVPVVIDEESLVVRKEVAEENRPGPVVTPDSDSLPPDPDRPEQPDQPALPTRFTGRVRLSPDRPIPELEKVVRNIVVHLTSGPKSKVSLTLEIEAEVPEGIDRNKERTLVENANVLEFEDKDVR